MKKVFILLVLFITIDNANAQNYILSFSASGLSNSVSTVVVENLTTGTSLNLDGNDLLSLTIVTEAESDHVPSSSELKIFPNPMSRNSVIQFRNPVNGQTIVTVLDLSGKVVLNNHMFLESGNQRFIISGLASGSYIVRFQGRSFSCSGKIISTALVSNEVRIIRLMNENVVSNGFMNSYSKGSSSIIEMVYSTGDILKFTGTSGKYCTIKTDTPMSDKTINFDFVSCEDGDGYNYAVVEIASQIWMAENLKTSRYNDEEPITLVPTGTPISAGYCLYDDNEFNRIIYGSLYNWYTVNSGKVCPIGWHVPTDEEFTALALSLGGTSMAGGRLKEKGAIHWDIPNVGATNESGFTALPGGFRNGLGYRDISSVGLWWTSTEVIQAGPQSAWGRALSHFEGSITRSNPYTWDFYSVRCIKSN